MSDPELNMPDANQNPADDAGSKPRRGRPPKAQADSVEAQPYSEDVTYVPSSKEDPAETKMAGVTFHANVPKTINAHAAGTPHERLMHQLIESARGNKFFHVGEFDPAKAVAVREKTVLPKTSEQYRAHVVNWLPGLSSDGEFTAKWMAEEGLRQACGVGSDDLEYLGSLIAPKRAELQKHDLAA